MDDSITLADAIKEKSPKKLVKYKWHRARRKYKPTYCQKLLDHMCEGFSFDSFAITIGVSKETLKDWLTQHSLFDEARRQGLAACQLWWEECGKSRMNESKTFAQQMWIFNMKHRFAWSDTSPDQSAPPKVTFVFEELKNPNAVQPS